MHGAEVSSSLAVVRNQRHKRQARENPGLVLMLLTHQVAPHMTES